MTREERAARDRAVANVDRMGLSGADILQDDTFARRHGLRPLKPPPGRPLAEPIISAARRALLRDRKLGIVDSPTARPNRAAKPDVAASWFDHKDRDA